MLGVAFFIQSTITDQNNNFQQKCLLPIEDIEYIGFLSTNVKRYFTSDFFVKFWGPAKSFQMELRLAN